MSVNRWKMVAMPVVILGLASPMLINCGALPKLPGPAGDLADAAGGCDEMTTGDFSKLKIQGGAAVEGKVKGFLSAAADLKKLANDVEVGLIKSCGDLGTNLGMAPADVAAEAKGDGEGAKKVCEAVAAKVGDTLKANASAQLDIAIDPPKCYADIDFMTTCFGECGSPVSGGDLSASCSGGDISGTCGADCKGSCTVDAGADCTGTCKASCSGKCDAGFSGTCGGACKGKCDGKDAKGKCAGKCEGSCDATASGTCTGTCGGKCSGSCEMKAAAKCSGSCSGGCSAKVTAPKCSGEFKPPKVDPSCQINCAAKGVTHMKCDPPNVRVIAKGAAGSDVQKLIVALQTSLPEIVKIQMGMGEKLIGAVTGLAKGAVDIKGVAASAGAKALVCIGSAVSATAGASASLNVNVHASASVGGSVGAKGGS